MKTTLVIKTIEDKELWNEAAGNNLLQSWEWGEFQEKIGRKMWRIGLYEISHNGNKEIVDLKAIALGQLIKTKLRTHLYVSNGPVFAQNESIENVKNYFIQIMGYFKAIGIHEKALFVRYDPLLIDSPEHRALLKNLNLKMSTTHVQAESTVIIDLQKSEEELLKSMREETRRKIKKALKSDIKVEVSAKPEDFEIFWPLFQQTFTRQKFVPSTKGYYQLQFELFALAGKAKLYFAKDSNDQILAAVLVYFFGNTAFYLHGASVNSESIDSGANAPRLTHWKVIQDAKSAGFKYYDLYGIANEKKPGVIDRSSPWFGITQFKRGFGGEMRRVVRAHDHPLNIAYFFIKLLESQRGIWGRPYYKVKSLFSKTK